MSLTHAAQILYRLPGARAFERLNGIWVIHGHDGADEHAEHIHAVICVCNLYIGPTWSACVLAPPWHAGRPPP